MSVRLTKLTLRGFKTIRELVDFRPEPINVLIGANGAGKSNFISFFRMLSWMMSRDLEQYVTGRGGANRLLHDGAQSTAQVEAQIELETESGMNDYKFRLVHIAEDAFMFAEEAYRYSSTDFASRASWSDLGAGHREAKLVAEADGGNKTARVIRALLRQCNVFQFHNTSETARMRQKWRTEDGRWLKEDAANLAPFLLRLRDHEPPYYKRILDTVRSTLPFLTDFELEPENGSVLLRWREKGTDEVFGASQASDGMLRTIALIALLQQPEDDLPGILFLDEPELGLHPYAADVLVDLLRAASRSCQVILATQSTALVDRFEPEDIVVVERRNRESQFNRLGPDKLKDWLEEYSMSELWEKNVIGGQPQP